MALTNTSYASNEQTTQTFRGALKAEVAVIFPTVDIATSSAILFEGATVRHTDGKLYMSNGIAFEQIQGSDGGGSETAITIKQKYESNPDTNAYTDAEKSKLSGLSNYDDSAIISSLSNKVDKVTGKQLSDENYTLGEKQKLAGLESSKFLGLYTSLSALQAAHPTASDGNYADVDLGVGSDTQRYIWDVNDAKYIASGAGTPLTAAQVKSLYESNPDTNAYTNAEKSKLASITEIFTTVLKNTYDSTVTWITTNGSNLISHLSRTDNPHGVTKAQVGLGSVADGANMAKSVYDPTGINADAFDWNNFTNKPAIPSAQVNSDWSAVGGVAEILNKPTIPTIDPNATIQGNTFNGADQLVKLDSESKLPAVDGSLLTGITVQNTIYTSNGALVSNREVSLSGNYLQIKSGSANVLKAFPSGRIAIGDDTYSTHDTSWLSISDTSLDGTERYFLKLQSGYHPASRFYVSQVGYNTNIRTHVLNFYTNFGANKVMTLTGDGSKGTVTIGQSSMYIGGQFVDFANYPIQCQAGFYQYAGHSSFPWRNLKPNGYAEKGGTSLGTYGSEQLLSLLKTNDNVIIGYKGSLGSAGQVDLYPSAKLIIESTTQGFLPPRMNATQAETISAPAEGLLVYVNDVTTPGSTITTKGWWGYSGSAWVKLN